MPIVITALLARLFPPSNAITDGASPKVTVPGAILAAAAAALFIAAAIAGDGELAGYGAVLLGASGVVGVAGAAASPGSVVVGAPVVGEASDAALGIEAAAHLDLPVNPASDPATTI